MLLIKTEELIVGGDVTRSSWQRSSSGERACFGCGSNKHKKGMDKHEKDMVSTKVEILHTDGMEW